MFDTNKAGFEKISETAQCVNGNQLFFPAIQLYEVNVSFKESGSQ